MELALLLFAFSAGAAAFFAPCSVAMLPAYVSYAVRPAKGQAGELAAPHPKERLGNQVALVGVLPLTVGAIPLFARGLSTVNIIPAAYDAYLLSIELSVGLLLLGGLLIAAGLLLGGKGPAAGRGLTFGGLATIGFFLSFLAVGLPVAFLARGLAPYLTYLSIAVGLALVAMGVLMLFGRSISPRLPSFEADVSGPKGFFKFGLAYGVAGLSCTFPVFLAVVAAGLVSGGVASAAGTFAAYAAGKASVLVAVTVVTVAGGSGLGQTFKAYAPTIAKASAYLMILAGAYMTYYFGSLTFVDL